MQHIEIQAEFTFTAVADLHPDTTGQLREPATPCSGGSPVPAAWQERLLEPALGKGADDARLESRPWPGGVATGPEVAAGARE